MPLQVRLGLLDHRVVPGSPRWSAARLGADGHERLLMAVKQRPVVRVRLSGVGHTAASWPPTTNTGTRPIPVSQVAPKRSDGEPSFFLFRFYEAAARDLTHPAMSRHSSPPGEHPVKTDSRSSRAPALGRVASGQGVKWTPYSAIVQI